MLDADAARGGIDSSLCVVDTFNGTTLPDLSRRARRRLSDSEGEPECNVAQRPNRGICDKGRNTLRHRLWAVAEFGFGCTQPKPNVASCLLVAVFRPAQERGLAVARVLRHTP